MNLTEDLNLLSSLATDYVFYPENHAISQWKQKYNRLSLSLQRSQAEFVDNSAYQTLLHSHEKLAQFFAKIFKVDANPRLYQENVQNLALLLTKMRTVLTILHRQTETDILQSNQWLQLLISLSFIIFALFLTTLLFFLHTRVARPLSCYQQIFNKVSDSNPVLCLPPMVHDEFSQMVEYFNETLKQRTVAQNQNQQITNLFQAVFEHAAVGIAFITQDGSWLKVNHTLCEILRYQRSALLETDFLHIIHTGDRALNIKKFKQLLAGELPHYSIKPRFLRKDRNIAWVDLTVTLIHHNHNDPDYLLIMVHDITEHKQLAEKGQELLAWKQAILDNSSAGILVTNQYRKIYDLNQRLLEMLGYEKQALLGQSTEMLYCDHASYIKFGKQVYSQTADGKVQQVEQVFRKKSGELFWCHISGRAIAPPDLSQGVVWMMVDISQRKLTETRYQSVFDFSPIGILWLTAEGFLQDCNPAVERMLGYNKIELKRMNLYNLFLSDKQHKNEHTLSALLREERDSFILEQRYQHKNGTFIWSLTSAFAIRNEAGEVITFVAMLQDISKRKKMEGQLQLDLVLQKETEMKLEQAKQQAESANRAKSVFLANMSHELRTPLNAMLGYAQILQRDTQLSDKQKQAINTIKHSGDHLLLLINDVLDLAKIEAGRLELHIHNCVLPRFFEDLYTLFQVMAQQKGIMLKYQANTDLPNTVAADEKRLRQICMNLLSNAIKFTEQGQVDIQTAYQNGMLEIQVSDTGIGIPTQRLKTLFQPFVQVGSEYYQQQGTGLGLSISKNLIEQMQGTISINSEEGVGTCFKLKIPLPVLEQQKRDEKSSTSQHPAIAYQRNDHQSVPYRVLVIDHTKVDRQLIIDLLEPLGFTVLEAKDCEEGIKQALAQQPDIILLTLLLPKMESLAVLPVLLKQESLQQTKIVAIAAHTFDKAKQAALKAGCHGYIDKPVNEIQLQQVLQQHLALEWVYTQAVAINSDNLSTHTLDLSVLSPDILEQLEQSMLRGNSQQTQQLLEHIQDQHTELAASLTHWFNLYEYQRILDAISEAKNA
ncbi:PAS domain S-box protein [Candidatus Venteria ishoeyi]|uniref:PAS domain-containing hybrid sensor histidine kinase/response regulator n=1 Tax=Candidatus Venteria ishoeyi TaxID=1899563 RepID=UPI0025A60765|nr:PAS domain S-box protein [Candidatus Venteria ishoeyi]MDM8546610.1 PAS domain S-box protein [Candidatus Venteria ishoeyi]